MTLSRPQTMGAADPRTARKPAPVLERTTFKTSRLAEFCSQRELIAQTGHQVRDWPLVILKELTDNAIDICEEKEIAVKVSTKTGTITIADNGPGIPPQTVADVLDFSVRVSSREAYVSPTRGAQDNALKTLLAMGFALDSNEPRPGHWRRSRSGCVVTRQGGYQDLCRGESTL
jgi:hypothetical protein